MSDSPATRRIRVARRNGNNQGFVTGADAPKDAAVARRGNVTKWSAAATRALVTYPAAERAAIADAAVAAACADDRAIRDMVWDVHVAVASGDVTAIRPGVGDDAAVAAWRRVRGLKAPAVASPAAR